MLTRDKIAIGLSIIPVVFLLFGAYMLSQTNESITAAAITQINKVKIGSENEQERITDDILLKKDTGTGTATSTTLGSGITTSTKIGVDININVQSSSVSSTTSVQVAGGSTTVTSTVASTSVSSTSVETTTSITTTTANPITYSLKPKTATDTYGIDQVSPDGGDTDGTVELVNTDTRWLTTNGEYVEVTSWDTSVPGNPMVETAIASCTVSYVNNKPSNVEFSFNIGTGWSNWHCSQLTSPGNTYNCDLSTFGVDTSNEINNVKLRCRMTSTSSGGIGFALDAMALTINTK